VNRQALASNKRPPSKRGSRQRYHFRGGGSLLFLSLAKISPGAHPFRYAYLSLVDGRSRIPRRLREVFGFQSSMHSGVYLMIAALVLMGLQLGYALYQLATFVL